MNEYKEIIDQLEICFQELIDKGFYAEIRHGKIRKLNFINGPILNIDDAEFNPTEIPCFGIRIHKDYNYHNCLNIGNMTGSDKSFNIKDAIEYILFTKSYMKDMFNLNIEYLSTFNDTDNCYLYENIEYLPIDKNILEIGLYFIEN